MSEQISLMWFRVVDDANMESLYTTEHILEEDENPPCPSCGKPTHYWEGQIDELPDGSAIMGACFICGTCHIESSDL